MTDDLSIHDQMVLKYARTIEEGTDPEQIYAHRIDGYPDPQSVQTHRNEYVPDLIVNPNSTMVELLYEIERASDIGTEDSDRQWRTFAHYARQNPFRNFTVVVQPEAAEDALERVRDLEIEADVDTVNL